MPHGERPHFSRAAGPGKIHSPDQGRQLVSFNGGFPVADSESPFGLCFAKAISALLRLWGIRRGCCRPFRWDGTGLSAFLEEAQKR